MARYRRIKVDLNYEENLTIGCVTSDTFLRDFKIFIGNDLHLLKSNYMRTIVSWTFQYYDRYKRAPNASIMEIFASEKESMEREEDRDLIQDTLSNISEKYVEEQGRFDTELIYSQSEKYIKERAVTELADKIKGLSSKGNVQEAEKEIATFRRKEKDNVHGVSILSDMSAVEDMFETDRSLVDVPGDFGELVQELYGGDLVYIGGPSKSSKTWNAMELALICVKQGLNVGWFSLEMNLKLMNRRFAQMIARGSFKQQHKKEYVPYFDKDDNIQFKKQQIKHLSQNGVERAYKLLKRQSGNGNLVVYDSTTSGNTVSSIKNTIINASQYDGVDFDVIFVDQLNLIKAPYAGEKRHQLDGIALDLKREIAQDMNLLVCSPVQYNRSALKNDVNDESSISEAYSLFSHASLLISLNQTKEEKAKGIMRMTASGRHADYSGEIVALTSLVQGKAMLDTRWKRKITNYNDVTCNVDMDALEEFEEAGDA